MKNNSIKRVLGVGVSIAVAATLAACSSGGGTTSNSLAGWKPDNSRATNQIHVLVLGDAAASAEKAAAARFNKTSKVKVVIDTGSTAGTEYNNTVRSQLGTKTGPDIFMSWGASGINPLVKAGGLLPLDDFIKADPKLKSSFLPSVFNGEVISGKSYGIPMRGVAPEFLYYNKSVLDTAGLTPPKTWDDLLSDVSTLKAQNVIPIALAGADQWPGQIWLQYLYTREIGNAQVAKGLAGDSSVWTSAGSKKALADLTTLIKAGGFGSNFDSVKYGSDGSAALLGTGKAAFELMGSWEYATISQDKSNIGWTAFPSLNGGAGAAGEINGNLSNYYNVAANTRYPNTVRDFLKQLYGTPFLQDQIALGNTPPTTDAATLIDADTKLDPQTKTHLDFVVQLVKDAPSFQLSWDQTIPAAQQNASHAASAAFFDNQNVDQFISAQQSTTAASN